MSIKADISGAPVERILAVATELFYRNGYRATGINEVIDKSGVAKATFYKHFPAKEDLARAYLKTSREAELAFIEQYVAAQDEPLNRFLAVMGSLKPWAIDTDFRGCAFINMASEVPDPHHTLRREGTKLYDEIRSKVSALSKALIASDEKKYGHLNDTELTEEYMVLFTGAVALAEIYHDIWPIDHALHSARRLVGG